MDINILLDATGFIFILLSFIYASKIYFMIKLQDCLWLMLATFYGSILRGIHLLRHFGIIVPSALEVSHAFGLFYVLLFLGVMAYYKPIKNMWESSDNQYS